MYCKHSDHLKEECGVFGIFGTEEASVLTTLGLHSFSIEDKKVRYSKF